MKKPRQPTGGVRFFETPEQMWESIQRSNAQMQEIPTTDWQEEMKEGDCFVRLMEVSGEPFDIYGEVIPIKYEEDRELMRMRPDLRMCRCFSQLCPEGELGTVFIVTMSHKITRELFESAREQGWPLFYQAFGEPQG